MKKILPVIIIFFLFSSSFSQQIKQTILTETIDSVNALSCPSSTLINDNEFALALETIATKSIEILNTVYATGGQKLVSKYEKTLEEATSLREINRFYYTYDIDSTEMLDRKIDLYSAAAMFVLHYKDFRSFTDSIKTHIIRKGFERLTEHPLQLANPANKAVTAIKKLKNRLGPDLDRLSGCLENMLITMVIENPITSMLTSTPSSVPLTETAIRQQIRQILCEKQLMGWQKLISFAICADWKFTYIAS